MATLAPLKDVQRIIEWEELPVRAREVPDNWNSLAGGVLLKHQIEAISLEGDIIAIPKGRRTGITYAFAHKATIIAASRKSAGGANVFYIGDTKEKGLEFIGYCAKFARVIAEAQGQGVSSIEQFLFEDQDEKGNTKYINAYRIRFASGYQICVLSSRPANIRGLQGIVIMDEVAFQPDSQGVLDAATALLIWGGKIVAISSLNGKKNPFTQFCSDIEKGLYGEDAKVYKVTFDQAVENGLYERVCLMKGETPTPEGKQKWYTRIRSAYGPRKAAMREELDVIPRDGGGVCIPGVWIERAMREERPIIRLVCDDDFAHKSEEYREKWGAEWIQKNLKPLFKLLDPRLEHVFGQDFARHRHCSVITPLEITSNLTRVAPFVIELYNVPTRQQEQILWATIDALPNFRGGAMDATGPGQTLAEFTAGRYRIQTGDGPISMIHEINLSRQWYGAWMPKMVRGFEDDNYDIPRDLQLENDLRAVEEIDGIPMVPKVERKDLKDPELFRHGDFAISLVMGEYAALNKRVFIPIEFKTAGPLRPGYGGAMNNYMRT
jgi:phage FluMu gp28-like protein